MRLEARKPYTFYIDPHLMRGLDDVKKRDGIPVSEQIRRAIAMWLETKAGTTQGPSIRARQRKRR